MTTSQNLAEGLYTVNVQSVGALQLNQFLTGNDIAGVEPHVLNVPGVVRRTLSCNPKSLLSEFSHCGIKVRID